MPESSAALPKLDTRQRIELTEGVEIWLPIAGPAARAMAYLIDFMIRWTVLVVAMIIIGILSPYLTDQVAEGISLLLLFFWSWFYYVYYEVGKRGASPGKRMMGLRVVQTSGAPLTWSQAIVRNFLRFIDALPVGYAVGLVACLTGNSFQRLGDLAAGTCVIYAKQAPTMNAHLPPHLTPLAPTMPLERQEQLALVSYLERAGLWSDARREELANHVTTLTHARGPEGVTRLLRMAWWIRNAS